MLAIAVAVSIAVPLPVAGAEDDLTFSGSGWGHGVGLSQYGARAMADGGATAAEILAHYFPGTMLRDLGTVNVGSGLLDVPTPIWVGLLQDQPEVAFVIEEGTADLCLDETDVCVRSGVEGESWRFGPAGNGLCMFSRMAEDGAYVPFEPYGSCSASVRPLAERTIFRIPRKARSYRDGTLRFRTSPASGRYHLSIELGIEDYVRGVQELPDFWPGSSLEAQAVVSRTIVVSRLLEHGSADSLDEWRMELCACHLGDDDPEQSFGGYTAELGHPFWQGRVGGTAGLVLTHDNQVARVRFTSSTGGRTESNDAAGGESRPFLVSVDDSAALTGPAANPFSSWVSRFDEGTLGSAFGFRWLTDVQVVSWNESGSARSVVMSGIITDRPATVTTTGMAVRDALGLRSAYFEVSVVPRFDDVSPGHPFAGEILGLSKLGVTSGCTATLYCPSDVVTREQMAAFLVRALDLASPVGPVDTFDDDNGSMFEAEIEALVHNGVTSGCTATLYCPSDVVTREQMAAFLVRALDLASPVGPVDTFDDDNGSMFEAEIEALVHNGVTSGCTATSYCPSDVVTREQMAAFLVRALAVPVV